jgi:hypothetical protein
VGTIAARQDCPNLDYFSGCGVLTFEIEVGSFV